MKYSARILERHARDARALLRAGIVQGGLVASLESFPLFQVDARPYLFELPGSMAIVEPGMRVHPHGYIGDVRGMLLRRHEQPLDRRQPQKHGGKYHQRDEKERA